MAQFAGMLLGTLGEIIRCLADFQRAGTDRLCGTGNRSHGVAQTGRSGVEVLFELTIGGTKTRQFDSKIASGHGPQAVADQIDHFARFGIALFLRAQRIA